jgi:predicted phage tail protein
LSKPANAAVVIGTPAFAWLASAMAVKYQFQYDDNANFASPTYTSAELEVLSITPPSIAPGAYSWRVRAKDAAGNWSAWSATRTVTIQPAVPLAPALTAPVNAFLTNDTTPTFTWAAVAYGNTYQLEISNTATFAVKLRSFTGAAGILTYTSTALPAGTYYWHARAMNVKNAAGPWSAVRSFTIDLTPPAAPVLSKPVAGAQVTGTPAFAWLASASAMKYQFQYDDSASFASPNYTSAELSGLNLTPPTIAAGTYSWRVRAGDAAGNWSAWSALRTIRILP